MMKSKAGFKKTVNTVVQNSIREEVRKMVLDKNCLFRGGKSLNDLANFSWNDRYAELNKNCPTITHCLMAALTSTRSATHLGLASKTEVSIKPAVGTIMSIIFYLRNYKQNELQELNSMQMWLAGCKREVSQCKVIFSPYNVLCYIFSCLNIRRP